MTHVALVVGEALIDEFPDRRVVAGAPLHVAAHLAALGWSVSAITRVGADDDGMRIVETLERFGVDTSLVEVDPSLPTGRTEIELDGTDHTFDVVKPAAWDAIEGPPVLPEADVVYFGTLVMRDDRSRGALRRIIAGTDALDVVDLNLREPHYDDERIREALAESDVLKLNEDELPLAASAFGLPPDLERMHAAGPRWICVTRGADGATLSHEDGRRWDAEAPAIDVVDTVGAGDAFCATLVDGLATDRDPGETLTAATRRGAEIASQRGGLPEPPNAG